MVGMPLHHAGEVGWFKVNFRGKLLYVAKRILTNNVLATDLETLNLVNGSRIIAVNGLNYRIRLIDSGSAKTIGVVQPDPPEYYGSEWNEIFYRLVPSPTGSPNSNEGIPFAEWGSYNPADVSVAIGGNNTYTITMNKAANGAYLERGLFNVLYGYVHSTVSSLYRGWRPVLELIQ